jgi:hypothetical protein
LGDQSFGLGAGLLHDVTPYRQIAFHDGAELGARASNGIEAEIDESLPDRRTPEYLSDVLLQLGDDRTRSTSRRKDTVERIDLPSPTESAQLRDRESPEPAPRFAIPGAIGPRLRRITSR